MVPLNSVRFVPKFAVNFTLCAALLPTRYGNTKFRDEIINTIFDQKLEIERKLVTNLVPSCLTKEGSAKFITRNFGTGRTQLIGTIFDLKFELGKGLSFHYPPHKPSLIFQQGVLKHKNGISRRKLSTKFIKTILDQKFKKGQVAKCPFKTDSLRYRNSNNI